MKKGKGRNNRNGRSGGSGGNSRSSGILDGSGSRGNTGSMQSGGNCEGSGSMGGAGNSRGRGSMDICGNRRGAEHMDIGGNHAEGKDRDYRQGIGEPLPAAGSQMLPVPGHPKLAIPSGLKRPVPGGYKPPFSRTQKLLVPGCQRPLVSGRELKLNDAARAGRQPITGKLTKVVLALALLAPSGLAEQLTARPVWAAAAEVISVVADTDSLKSVQSSKVKVEMNNSGRYRLILLPGTNVFYGSDSGNVATILDYNGTAVNFSSLPLNYFRIRNNVIEMSRQKENVEFIQRVSIVNATDQGGYMKVELEAVNRSGASLNLGGTFYWDTMVNGNDGSPFEIVENGWRNYYNGVQVTAFYANTFNVVDADRIFMGNYKSPDSALLTGGSPPSAFTVGQTITASDTAAEFWWDAKPVGNGGARKFSTIVGIGPQNTPPTFTLQTPASGQTFYKGEQLQITGSAKDADAGDRLTVKWSLDGGTENVLTTLTANGLNQAFQTAYTLPDTLADGSHTLQVWVMDDKGGVSSASTVQFTTKSFMAPGTPVFTSVGTNGMTLSWDKKGNDASITYELKNLTTGQTYSAGTAGSYAVSGLTPSTAYTYAVRALKPDGTATGYSAQAAKYTLAKEPAGTLVTQAANTASATWTSNGNPVTTRYGYEIRNLAGYVLVSNTVTGLQATLPLTGLADGRYELYVCAMNGEGAASAYVSGGSLLKDTEGPSAPVLTLNPSNWTQQEVTVAVTPGADAVSGVLKSQIKLGGNGDWEDYQNPVTLSLEGETAVYARSVDRFGNTGAETSATAKIDRTPPEVPLIALNPPDWTRFPVIVTLTGGRDAGSGLAQTEYRLGELGQWTPYTSPFTVTEEGLTTVYARSIDLADNTSSESSAVIKVDTTAPEVPLLTLSETSWTRDDVRFTITGGEDSGSGTAKTQYRLGDNGLWQDYEGEVVLSEEGETVIYARTVDRVGNISEPVSAAAQMDKTAPSAPAVELSRTGWGQTTVDFRISGSSDLRPVYYEYSVNGGPFTKGDRGTVAASGRTVITARAIDLAGNRSEEVSQSVFIDSSAPVIVISPDGRDWSEESAEVTIRFEDADSGIDPAKRYYQITRSPEPPEEWKDWEDYSDTYSDTYTFTIREEGVWYVHAKVTDKAGNEASAVSKPIKLQKLPQAPVQVRTGSLGETSAELWFGLAEGGLTDGTVFEVLNRTTGQRWSVAYPESRLRDETLEGGTAYTYEITVRNHVGESPAATLEVLTLPEAPSRLQIDKVEGRPGEAAVSFTPVRGAERYSMTAEDPAGTIVYSNVVTDTVYQPVANLVPGTLYTIRVSGMNASGEGTGTAAGFLTLPAAPSGFAAVQIREEEIELVWDTVTSAVYYGLLRNGHSLYGGPDTHYVDTGLLSGAVYRYELYAGNETGSSPWARLEDLVTLPAKVNRLQIREVSQTAIGLHWEEVRGADDYVVLLNGVEYGRTTAGSPEFRIEGLEPGKEYRLEIRAQNASGRGAGVSLNAATIPDTPKGLHSAETTVRGTRLQWEAVPGADRYRVTINGETFDTADQTELEITGLSGSRRYEYEVAAGNAFGFSPPASASLLTLPVKPEHLGPAEIADNEISLSWDAVDTADGYIIYQNEAEIGRTSEPKFTAVQLRAGEAYRFGVQAVNETGRGEQAEILALAKPDAPVVVQVRAEAYRAEIIWEAVYGAAEYIVESGGKEIYRGAGRQAVLTGLSAGSNYMYTLRAVNSQGTSSSAVPVQLITLPQKPERVSLTGSELDRVTLDLSQTGITGAESYVIKRNGTPVGNISSEATKFEDTGLFAGTAYTYSISAINASGEGEAFLLKASTRTQPVSAQGIGVIPETHQVTVSWQPVRGAAGYVLKEGLNGREFTTTGFSQHLEDLQAGTEYEFTLIALNEDGAYSEPLAVKALTKPAAVQSVKAGRIEDTSVKLDWSDSRVTGADLYRVYRNGLEAGELTGEETVFQDVGLTPGAEYTYQVLAVNASGSSESGFELRVRTLPESIAVPATVEQITGHEATVRWAPSMGADGYRIVLGDRLYVVTGQGNTSFRLEKLESSKRYSGLQVIPFNETGEGKVIYAGTFDTLPVLDGLEMKLAAGTDLVELSWVFPSPNETFVIQSEGKEVYRGRGRAALISGLEGGGLYSLTLHAENEAGNRTESRSFTALTKPDRPEHITYTAGTEQIRLQLSPGEIKGAERWRIERDGKEAVEIPATAAYFLDEGLTAGAAYVYQIRAVNASGVSESAFLLTALTLPGEIPAAPKLGQGYTDGYEVIWANAPGAEGYRIYRGSKLLAETEQTEIRLTGMESAVLAGDIRIVPYNKAGEGQAAPVPAFVTLPSGDFSAEAVAFGTGSLKFLWKMNTDKALPGHERVVLAYKGREIYRGASAIGSFVWQGLAAGQIYEVSIWTENGNGDRSAEQILRGVTSVPAADPGKGYSGGSPAAGKSDKPAGLEPDDGETGTSEGQAIPLTGSNSGVKPGVYFEDIDRTFNRDQILELASEGIIEGVTPTRFEPVRPVTRAEFTALIVRMLGMKEAEEPKGTGGNPGGISAGFFRDVQPEDWFAPQVNAAAGLGMVSGIGEGYFGPELRITREQAAVILAKALKLTRPNAAGSGQSFSDGVLISHWAADSVAFLAGQQLITGYEDGSFRPLNALTRAEAAAIIYRLKKYISFN